MQITRRRHQCYYCNTRWSSIEISESELLEFFENHMSEAINTLDKRIKKDETKIKDAAKRKAARDKLAALFKKVKARENALRK